MRQHRPGPARHHSRQPAPLQPEPIMANGVHTAVKAVQPAAPNPVRDPAVAQAELDQLSPRDHTPLPPRKLRQTGLGRFPFPSRNGKRPTPEIRPLHRCRRAPRGERRERLGSPPRCRELLFKPATELATLIHTGQISSAELVAAALERIEALQPTINAFTHIDAEGAMAAAEAISADDPRPFAGVPIAIKDTAPVAGMPYTMGSDIFGDFVPGHDAFLVRRLRDAGFVIVGKTNMPEFGILPVSESRRFGPVRNPWDTDRTPGRLERRRRRGGGVRDAAARPRQRRRRLDPDPGVVLRARRAEAHARAHLARPGPGRRLPGPGRRAHPDRRGDGSAARHPEPATRSATRPGPHPLQSRSRRRPQREPGRLRIGYTTTAADRGRRSTPECERAVLDAAQLLSELGHDVEEVAAPWGDDDLLHDLHHGLRHPDRDGDVLRRPGHRPRADRRARGAALVDDLGGHPRAQRARLPARAHAARPASRAASSRSGRATTWCSPRRSPSARCGSARSTPAATTRGRTSAAPAASRPTPRSST